LGVSCTRLSGSGSGTAATDVSSETRLQILSLFKNGDPASLLLALPEVARRGDVQCVQRLLRLCHFEQWELDEAVVCAASAGSVPMTTQLLEKGAAATPKTFQASATAAVLQKCVERGCAVGPVFLDGAAARGRLFQLQWAAGHIDINSQLSTDLFAYAANGGDFPTPEWLRAQSCPWGSRVLSHTCASGSWECLAFALCHGCPLDGFALEELGALSLEGLTAA
jgi:hypothetical protein